MKVRKKRPPNPLRIDPTRTITLRKAMCQHLRKQFAAIRFDLAQHLRAPVTNAAPTKEKSFEKWLGEKFKTKLTSKNQEAMWQKYVDQGAKKGAKRAYKDVTKSKGDKFLKAAFAQPVSVDKVKYLATKTFDYVKGLTKKASLEMSKTLADGLVEGKSPREVAKTLSKQLDITQARAETIARTELISAHAEGQLMALEMLGVEEVGVMVEWSTTGDDKVCEKCEAMQGVVLKIKKAKGMLPLHPNCRCAWIPANVGEDDEPVKKTKKAVKKGVEDDELEFIWNAFCPTGEGGGVDPSCSPGVAARIPPAAQARFKQNVDVVHKHPDNVTAGKALIDATIAGTPDITFDEKRDLMRLRNDVVSGKKVLAGGYIPGLKQIHVGPGYEAGEGPVGELLPHNTAAHVYAHEYTHGLDGPDHEYSSSREWAEAHQEAKTLTRYAATHESESFAEFGRLLYAGDVDHAEVTRRFPKASAFFKQKGLWPGLTQNRSFFADCERDEKGRCLPSGAGARVSDAELKSAQKLARSKAKKTAEPSQEAVDRAEAEMPEIGANAYRKKLVGNKYQREARRNKLLKEFGDGKHCPCVYCGVKVTHGTLEQDKIYTTIQGGKYTMDNLVPSCGGCNKQRGDIPWKNIKWPKG